jgi:16S rRNA U1498 N3-methylase RsmE
MGENQQRLIHTAVGFNGMSHLGKIILRVETAGVVRVVIKLLVVDIDDFDH